MDRNQSNEDTAMTPQVINANWGVRGSAMRVSLTGSVKVQTLAGYILSTEESSSGCPSHFSLCRGLEYDRIPKRCYASFRSSRVKALDDVLP